MNLRKNTVLLNVTVFLKNPDNEKVRNIEMNVKEIREAKDELMKYKQGYCDILK